MARNRVLFLGNHDVGIAALDAASRVSDIVGVIAHPQDEEDGVRYRSLFAHASSKGMDAIRGKPTDAHVRDFAAQRRADIIWVTDYRYLIPDDIIGRVSGRAVNLHPSLLPAYRGRAPINWAIIEGAHEIGLTAHLIDEGVDTGQILMQSPIPLTDQEDVGDALRKLLPLYQEMTRAILSDWEKAFAGRRPQAVSDKPAYPARKPSDGRIMWTQTANEIRNLVRAVAKPYPGAFTDHRDLGRLYVWKCEISKALFSSSTPGQIKRCDSSALTVMAADQAIDITKWESQGCANPQLNVGTILGF